MRQRKTLVLMKKLYADSSLYEKSEWGWCSDSGYYFLNEWGKRINILNEYDRVLGEMAMTFNYYEEFHFQNLRELKDDINFKTQFRLANPFKHKI